MLVLKWFLLPFIIAPRHKGKGVGDCDMSKQSHKMIPFSEKVYKLFTWERKKCWSCWDWQYDFCGCSCKEGKENLCHCYSHISSHRCYSHPPCMTNKCRSYNGKHTKSVCACVSVTPVASDICRGPWNIAIISWYFCSFFHNENIFCLGRTFCLLSACCISMRSGFNYQNPG